MKPAGSMTGIHPPPEPSHARQGRGCYKVIITIIEEEPNMLKSRWIHMGTALRMNALNFPDKLGWQDKSRRIHLSAMERTCPAGWPMRCGKWGSTIRTGLPFWPSIGENGWTSMPPAARAGRLPCPSCFVWPRRISSISSTIRGARPLSSRSPLSR